MKKIIYILCSMGLVFMFQIAQAQNERNDSISVKVNPWSHSKEVGLNFTPLISSLVPFNIGDKQSGNIGIKTKFYGINYAFRFTFGSNLVSNATNQFFHMGLGYERRRLVSKKFTYTSGWEFMVDAIQEDANTNVVPFFGFAKFYGIEYNLNETFFIGTESQFALGLSPANFNVGAILQFKAPTAIFLNVRMFNNSKK